MCSGCAISVCSRCAISVCSGCVISVCIGCAISVCSGCAMSMCSGSVSQYHQSVNRRQKLYPAVRHCLLSMMDTMFSLD